MVAVRRDGAVFDCSARQGSLCQMARSARCDVRRGAAVFVESDETITSENWLCIRTVSSAPPAYSSPLGLVLAALAPFLESGGANIAPRGSVVAVLKQWAA